MDEVCMLQWVHKVLAPYVVQAPEGIIPILFLDSYRCHMIESVVSKIQELGVEVEHIPGGCTCLVQPVDIGINRPYKHRVKEQWEAWMLAEIALENSISAPKREDVRDWCQSALAQLRQEEQIVRNSWRHGAYTWFPPTCALPPSMAAV